MRHTPDLPVMSLPHIIYGFGLNQPRNSTDPIVCERSSDVRFGEPIGSERAR